MTLSELHKNNHTCTNLTVHINIIKQGIQVLNQILLRSKKCCCHYSMIYMYHNISQWVLRSDTQLSFWHNVKKSVSLKFKIMPIIVHVDFTLQSWLPLYISYKHIRNLW